MICVKSLKVVAAIRHAPCVISIRRLASNKPIITATSASPRSLLDEGVSIRVQNLQPNSKISIKSTLSERKNHFESLAHFIADERGNVDLEQQESVGGVYTGLEPMGLFWSLKPAPGARKGLRYLNKQTTKPVEFGFTVFNDHLELGETLTTSQPLASTMIQKWFMREDEVDIIKLDHGRIRGTLFKPKGPGPFPGVVDLFGATGGIIDFRAALLASHGFAALCLPYFAYEDTPPSIEGLELEYFEEAADWLIDQPYVKKDGLGVIGMSFGACIALKMAAINPQIKAVVSINGVPSFMSSFLHKGKEIGFPDKVSFDNAFVGDGEGLVTKNMLLFINDVKPEELTNIQDIEGRILFIVSEDDNNYPSSDGLRVALGLLNSHGKTNYEVITYPKAGHLIEPPYKPNALQAYNAPFGITIDFGGEMKAHAHACEDAWIKSLAFLKKYSTGEST